MLKALGGQPWPSGNAGEWLCAWVTQRVSVPGIPTTLEVLAGGGSEEMCHSWFFTSPDPMSGDAWLTSPSSN